MPTGTTRAVGTPPSTIRRPSRTRRGSNRWRDPGKQLTLHETGSTPLPALWDIHVGTIQGGNGWTTEQLEGTLQISAQYLNCSRDPCFARCGKAIGIGAPTENRASPETNRLDDIGAPANASVHQDLDLTVYRCHHLWQGSQRGRHAVQLPAAMVRNRNRCNAFVNGTTSVVACEDPFDNDRTTPKVADPRQVCPGHGRTLECGIDIDERHRPRAGNDNVRERRKTAVE